MLSSGGIVSASKEQLFCLGCCKFISYLELLRAELEVDDGLEGANLVKDE